MPLRETLFHPSKYVGAETHWLYSLTLVDKAGVAIPVSALSTVTLTLLDLMAQPYAIVNGCNGVSVKNDGARGVVTAQGVLNLTLSGGDTAIVQSGRTYERRRAHLEWVKTGSGDVAWHEVDFIVAAKTPVPVP